MQRYGSSETCGAPISNGWDDSLDRRMNTMGTPLPGVEVAIVDRETGEPVPAGVEGEMRLRGWCVMRRYLDDPEATAHAVGADGWLRSGDLGAMDDEGYVRFASRYVDVLKVGGENVAAVEIEQVLESHPAVAAAHVVPVPDPVLAEVPYAFVEIASSDYDAEAVLEFCRVRLARFKHPRHLRVIDRAELPLTGSGKVQKFKLRELAASEWSTVR
jgi:fatty-acyl-CoA synthase